MKERLIEFLSYLGIGQLKFENNVGLSRGFVNNIGENVTRTSLDKISNMYPELNINWLKTGEGEMLKTTCVNQQNAHIEGNYGGIGQVVGGKVKVKNNEGVTLKEIFDMLDERYQHLQRKNSQIDAIFEENRKLTDEIIRQNADFRIYNEAYRKLAERVTELTGRILEKEKL